MNIYEKIKNGDYETKLAYPKRPSKTCFNCGNNCSIGNDIARFCSKCGAPVSDDYELRLKTYQRELSEYKDDISRLNKIFKTDALQHCDIANHKAADKAFDLACNYASGNKLAFISFLEDLYELMVD